MNRTIYGALVLALSGAAFGQATSRPAVLGIGSSSRTVSSAATASNGYPLGLSGLRMFERYRGAATERGGKPAPAVIPMFVGVMRDDRGYAAYVEYPKEVVAVHVGDTVSWNNAKVTAITLDGLQIMEPGSKVARVVPLGHDLQGNPGKGGSPVPDQRQRESGVTR